LPGGPPLTWNDLLPGWPEDVTLDEPEPPGAVVPVPRAEPTADDLAYRPAWAVSTGTWPSFEQPALPEPTPNDGAEAAENPLSFTAAGAFEAASRPRWGAFDPGRRGVRALAAVAVVVVLIAAVLAWRSRPRVDPVAAPGADPVAEAAALRDDGPPASGDPAGPGAVGPGAAGAGPSGPATVVVVAVGGKVRKPGLVRLPPGARVADALQAAGGAAPGVDVAPLNLARKVTDGELIMVGVAAPPGAVAAAPPAPGQPGAGPVNLNTATLAELDGLPGVGPVLAQRILDARTAQGGFRAVGDLRQVDGIGAARFEQLKDLVTV
jgi:competence protein ComEA